MGTFGVLVAGAALTALVARQRAVCSYLALIIVTIASGGMFAVAARVWSTGPGQTAAPLLTIAPLGASLAFRVDELSALFLTIVSVIAFCVALYSVRYLEIYSDQSLTRYYPVLLVFLAGILGVVTVSDLFFFFVFWELMTLASYFLVIFEKEKPANMRAGLKYFIITHVATACMFGAAIALWSYTSSFSFDSVRQVMGELLARKPVLLHLVLGLFFIGFATKAGVLPFGDWLPDAYPAAPSSGSALFAGTMTKLGIYGLLRIFADMLPLSSATSAWGAVIAVFGGASVFVGTITALSQDDSKRLLSFHVIGQVGYMLLGIGTGLYFLPTRPALGALAMLAGVFHVVNHVCYKSLLFLNAGAVLYRTGTRELNRLGGLAALMPLTGATAVIASMSIAGVPPFSGFASKWLIYQSTIVGGMQFPLFIVLGLVAMFISLVTLASFLKFLGAVFYGKLPATIDASSVREVPGLMQVPQVILAVLCVLFGVLPVLPTLYIFRAVSAVAHGAAVPAYQQLLGSSPIALSFTPGMAATGVWSPLVVLAAFAALLLVSYGLMRLGGAPVREVECWYCGEEHADELVRFRATGLYGPFKHAFDRLYPRVRLPRIAFPRRLERAFDLDSWLYSPFIRAGGRLAERLSRTHSGIPQIYMLWQVVGVILVLALLFFLLKG
jgi:hydrogenase-4 component B